LQIAIESPEMKLVDFDQVLDYLKTRVLFYELTIFLSK